MLITKVLFVYLFICCIGTVTRTMIAITRKEVVVKIRIGIVAAVKIAARVEREIETRKIVTGGIEGAAGRIG